MGQRSLRTLPIAAACAAALTISAEDPVDYSLISALSIDWPSGDVWGSGGSFERFVHGDFTAIPGLDTAGIRDGRVFVLPSTASMAAVLRVDDDTTGVADLARIEGVGSDSADGLATVDPANGLRLWSYDTGGGGFTAKPVSPLWSGVSRLTSGDLDGDGLADDVAGALGTRVVAMTHDGTGFGNPQVFFGSRLVEDVAILDLDADGSKDFAALLDDGSLEFHTQNGSTIPPLPAFHPGGAIATVPDDGGSGDLLVWATRGQSNDRWWLQVLSSVAVEAADVLEFSPGLTFPLDDVDLVGLVAGDFNSDGYVDVQVVQSSFRQAIVLFNQGDDSPFPADHFDTSQPDVTYAQYDLVDPSTAPMPNSNGLPALRGRDPDGRAALVQGIDETGSVTILRDPFDTLYSGLTPIAAMSYSPDDVGTLHVYLNLPEPIDMDVWTHVHVVVWRQPTVGGFMAGLAEDHLLYHWTDELMGNRQHRLDIPINEPGDHWEPEGPLFHVQMRLVQATGLTIHERLAPIAFAMRLRTSTDHQDSSYQDALEGLEPIAWYDLLQGIINPFASAITLGSAVLIEDIPDFDFESDPPVLPPLEDRGETSVWP